MKYLSWYLVAIMVVLLILQYSRNKKHNHASCINTAIFPLKVGIAGKEIKQLQSHLNKRYETNLALSGVMDESTIDVLNRFLQRDSVGLTSFVKWGVHKIEIQ